jgi:hypothetical protein
MTMILHASRGFFTVALAAAFLVLPRCHGQEEEQAERVRNFLDVEHSLSMDFVTPHTKWAKPYAGGTLKVLFFAPWYQGSTEPREIIELLQRFDLSAQAVYFQPGSGLVGDGRADWYGGDPRAGTKRVLRLLDQPNDLLFVNQLKLDVLPAEVREKIRQKVVAGTGLVLVGENATAPFEEARRVAPEPAAGRFFHLRKGRVALLPSRKKLQFEVGWETQFDYQMQEQGRALMWAAKREPKARLGIELPSEPIARAALPSRSAKVIWGEMPPGSRLTARLRRRDGITRELKTWEVSGSGSSEVVVPIVREGGYSLDVLATANGRTHNWATRELQIRAERHVEAVELERDWTEVNEKTGGKVRLSGKLKPDDRLSIRLVDKHRRIVDRKDAGAAGSVPFDFDIQPWMPMLLSVEAVLESASGEVSSAQTFLRVTHRNRDQFNFVMWNQPTGDLAAYGIESLARNGVTLLLQGGPPTLALAAGGIPYIPYTTSFRASSHTTTAMLDPATGFLKTGCVYDTEKMRETIRQTVDGARRAREHGVFAYSLGDENAVRASCLSPYCLHAYRRYLKEIYGGIGALNAEWGAAYRAFDEIELLRDGDLPSPNAPTWFKEYFMDRRELHRTDSEGAQGKDLDKQIAFGDINDEMRALQSGNFARWYDRQAFQNYTYVQWCKQFQKAFKELDPRAWTGFEGTDSFAIRRLTTRSRQGGDLDLFVRELDYFGPYNDPANEVVRSIARPGFPRGNWIGYDADAGILLGAYWGQVTDGMNLIQWWRWDNLSGYHGFLGPHLSPLPAAREVIQDTQIVRDGLGTLLMGLKSHDDGLAMLYSMPSTYVAHFDGNRTYGDYKQSHDAWRKILHGAGLQFSYVTDRMLRLGEFDASRYKVLLLPLSLAMSAQEAEVVRRFVQQGGTVIADVRPALYDGHTKPLLNGLLDDVFGVRRSGKREASVIDRMSVDGEQNGHKIRMRWGNWHGHDVFPQMKVDPTVEVTTGKPLGQAFRVHYWAGLNVPVAIVNQFGKGRAILLNWPVFQTPSDALIADLVASAGVAPAIRVTRPDGVPLRNVEVTRWNNGGTELLALLGSYQGEVRVRLHQARFVSDLKKRKSLGRTADFAVALRPNRAEFFALQPEPVSKPQLKLPTSPARLGEVVSVTIQIPHASGRHPVIIRATTPAGLPAPWLDRTVIAGPQPLEVTLPLAHNDSPGDWVIRAVDLFGNLGTAVTLHVRHR